MCPESVRLLMFVSARAYALCGGACLGLGRGIARAICVPLQQAAPVRAVLLPAVAYIVAHSSGGGGRGSSATPSAMSEGGMPSTRSISARRSRESGAPA